MKTAYLSEMRATAGPNPASAVNNFRTAMVERIRLLMNQSASRPSGKEATAVVTKGRESVVPAWGKIVF